MTTVYASIGLPGSLKSTLFRALNELIPDSVWINQDEFGGDAKTYHRQISICQSKVILADKCHHNSRVRGELRASVPKGAKIIWIVIKHPDDRVFETKKSALTGLARIRSRQGHRTLPPENVDQAMATLQKQFEPLTVVERETCQFFEFDITWTSQRMLQKVCQRLKLDVSAEAMAKALEKSIAFETHLKDIEKTTASLSTLSDGLREAFGIENVNGM
jgi:hypothetical protein